MALSLHFLRSAEQIDLPMQQTEYLRVTRAERRAAWRADRHPHAPESRLGTLGDVYARIDEDLSDL